MSPLHHIGNITRDLFLQIPLGWVRLLFVLVPLVLLAWILRLPRAQTQAPAGAQAGFGSNLRFWAALALLFQILIYSLF